MLLGMTEATPHILVVDDDTRLRELLKKYLRDHGFTVSTAQDAQDARAKLEFVEFDGMVLDIMMPGESGLSFAQHLRKEERQLPILMLTAMGEAEHRIQGLEMGVDDYLAKPFEPRELVLRLQAILRRTAAPAMGATAQQTVQFGPFECDLKSGKLTQDGEPVYLTTSETQLLKMLAEKAGQPISREELARAVISGEGDNANDRSVDVQINRLRKKIESQPSRPVYIQTVRGAGYALVV